MQKYVLKSTKGERGEQANNEQWKRLLTKTLRANDRESERERGGRGRKRVKKREYEDVQERVQNIRILLNRNL